MRNPWFARNLWLVASIIGSLMIFADEPSVNQESAPPTSAEAEAMTSTAISPLVDSGADAAPEAAPATTDQAAEPPAGAGTVLIIPVRDQIGPVLAFSMRRAFRMVEELPNLQCVILDMDTPGGRLDLTEEIIDRIRAVDVPVYVYINTKAQSAGAIISLACDAIYMAPGSRIGAAAPILMAPGGGAQELPDYVKEKFLSDTRAMVRGLAEENGYIPELAVAFVDQEQEVKVGERVVNESGKLLVLTAQEAIEVIPPRKEPLLATAIIDDIDDLLAQLGLEDATVHGLEEKPSEQLARWITMLAPLLVIGFMLGFYTEINTPGFGVAGTIAVVCLVLYLFGHFVAGLAGYEEVALIVIGIVLLIVELFVIPGFGLIGFAGVGCILTGLFLSMLPSLPDDLPELPNGIGNVADLERAMQDALIMTMVSLIGASVGIWLMYKYLPRLGPFSKLILQASTSASTGYVGVDVTGRKLLVGKEGIALTALRPSGTVRIEGKRLDVVTSGDYLDKGDRVRVTAVNGPRLEVERIETS